MVSASFVKKNNGQVMSELPYCDCCSHAEASKNGKEVYDIGVFVGAGGA